MIDIASQDWTLARTIIQGMIAYQMNGDGDIQDLEIRLSILMGENDWTLEDVAKAMLESADATE